jgi:hypothetical protein
MTAPVAKFVNVATSTTRIQKSISPTRFHGYHHNPLTVMSAV